jgi:peptidyl-prolyl cis-trans isomerase B (cyclophilin B)
MMKKIAIFIMVIGLAGLSFKVNESEVQFVIISTSYGDMKLKLYNETPGHRDNFIKLVQEKYYDGLLFHRVIKDFMIQGGDPNSRTASEHQNLGNGGPGYTIPKEVNPNFIHKKGALSAARQPDRVNPQHASSGSQFYIVQGKVLDASVVLQMEERRNGQNPESEHWFYSEDQLNTYTTIGGAPHLDGSYTVFGELTEGFNVLDSIALVPVDKRARPLTNIPMEMYLIK